MSSMTKTRKKGTKVTLYIVRLALLSAMGAGLMRLSFPIFPAFGWLQIDFGDLPVMLAAFGMGPVAGIIVAVIKNLLNFAIGTGTWGVGEVSNAIMGITFSLISGFVYKRKHNFKGVLIGLALSVVGVILMSIPSNLVLVKVFEIMAGFDLKKLPPVMGMRPEVVYFTMGVPLFNLIKFTLTSAACFLVYKQVKNLIFNDRYFGLVTTARNFSAGEWRTLRLGRRLGKKLKGGDVVTLDGDLGAGKTVFCKGIALGLGITDTVVSPTFTIHQQYKGRLTLNHFDMYRLDEGGAEEFTELLYDKSAVAVIEWSENVKNILPEKVIKVRIINNGGNNRIVEITR